MGLTPGFKQTEIGVVPQDWGVTPLGRLISSVEYGSSAKSNKEGRTPVLRMGNLQGGKIDWNDLVFTDDESEIRKYSLIPGDVLFNRTNTIDLVGKTALYKGERAAIFAGYLIRVKADNALLHSGFLNYVLNSEFSKKHSAKILSVAVGQANINGQKLKSYPIPCPPTRAEQETIAEALSDVDALLESVEKLIVKKRDLKQGAMQELLTGKKRLPGFRATWEMKRLGEICQIAMGRTPPRLNPEYWGSGHTWLSIGDLQAKLVSESKEEITALAAADMKAIPKGTLLMSFKLSIGRLCFAGCDLYTNEAICSFNDLRAIPDFLYYALGRTKFALYGKQAVKGYTLNSESLRLIEVCLPSNDEQTAIATILSDMDAEIAALETKLIKVREFKQGMMQALLTGRTRLA